MSIRLCADDCLTWTKDLERSVPKKTGIKRERRRWKCADASMTRRKRQQYGCWKLTRRGQVDSTARPVARPLGSRSASCPVAARGEVPSGAPAGGSLAPAGGSVAGRSVAGPRWGFPRPHWGFLRWPLSRWPLGRRSVVPAGGCCALVRRDLGRTETGVSLFGATYDTCRYHIGPVFGKVVVTI